MANGVSYLMDEYQTLYDNYVKERTDQQNKIKEQQEQLAEQLEQLAAKDNQLAAKDNQLNTVISSAISALVASGKSAEEIAALLNIPVDNVRKLINNNL
ncbi:MAG: hypothetical protein IK025_01885 [Bacteroidales bacterium]|nr:hypothetical protein [Bacteroidales bacterium]